MPNQPDVILDRQWFGAVEAAPIERVSESHMRPQLAVRAHADVVADLGSPRLSTSEDVPIQKLCPIRKRPGPGKKQ